MPSIQRHNFVRNLQNRRISVLDLQWDPSTDQLPLAHIDANRDGYISGGEEADRLFSAVDAYDWDGNSQTMDRGNWQVNNKLAALAFYAGMNGPDELAAAPLAPVQPDTGASRFVADYRRASVTVANRFQNMMSIGRGPSFPTASHPAKANSTFWIRDNKGGFRVRPGVSPAAAMKDILNNGSLYSFECAAAITVVMNLAILETLGEGRFNQLVDSTGGQWGDRALHLSSWEANPYATFVKSTGNNVVAEHQPLSQDMANQIDAGVVGYVENSTISPELGTASGDRAAWQGENMLYLERYRGDETRVFAFPFGITTVGSIRQDLSNTAWQHHMETGVRFEQPYVNNVVVLPQHQAAKDMLNRFRF